MKTSKNKVQGIAEGVLFGHFPGNQGYRFQLIGSNGIQIDLPPDVVFRKLGMEMKIPRSAWPFRLSSTSPARKADW